MGSVSLGGVTFTGIGALFVYGGLTGRSPLAAALAIIKGQSPAIALQASSSTATASPLSGGVDTSTLQGIANASGGAASFSGSPQAAFQKAAEEAGWGPNSDQWSPLTNIEMNEAGYNPTATNPSSAAFGIAQALGHGNANTQGSYSNMYGGFGLSDAQAKLANSADPYWQSKWMMNYIASRYGNPANAWAQYHHADGSKWY